jgi:hypothetical protein
LLLGVLVLGCCGFWLCHRWFGISKEEQKFRSAYTAEYANQPRRQEEVTHWISAGVIKRLAKHGPYAEVFVGPAYYKCDANAKADVAQTVFVLYFTEDKSFRQLVIVDAESGKRVTVYDGVPQRPQEAESPGS